MWPQYIVIPDRETECCITQEGNIRETDRSIVAFGVWLLEEKPQEGLRMIVFHCSP